jgi:hypothetical protein
MMDKPGSADRFASLDGLRGIFALAVVVFHASFASHLFTLPLVRAGYFSVDFFFVLSGFVIAYAYAERVRDFQSAREFIIKRIGRVWPLHIAMLFVLVGLELLKQQLGVVELGVPFTNANSPYAFLTNFFLLQSLDLHSFTTWNYPAWSISAEFCAYLLFALICLVARRWALWAAAAVVMVSAATIVANSTTGMDLTFHLGAVRGCLGFFLGWLAYAAYRRWPPRGGTVVELVLVAVIVVFLCAAFDRTLGYFAPFVFAIAIYLLAGRKGAVTRALETRPLQFLGRIRIRSTWYTPSCCCR